MAYPVASPAGYVAPASFDAYAAVTSTSNQYTAIQRIQNNILGVGYDLNQLVPKVNTVSSDITSMSATVSAVNTSVNANNAKFSNYSTKLARIETKIDSLNGDGGMNYETAVLTGLLLAVIFAVSWKG